MLICNPRDLIPIYVGDNVYNLTGAGQTKVQTVANGVTATYHLKLQNDGNVSDTFKVTGPPGSSGWTVRYYDAVSGGNDITAEVTGAGWTSGSLAPGASLEFRVEVTPGPTVRGGVVKHVFVTATSVGNPTRQDVVKASTTVERRYQPDLLIRNLDETTFTGNDLYNLNGEGQTKAQTVSSGKVAKYPLAVQNDGNVAERFTVTAATDPRDTSGWEIRYYDGVKDITPQVTGAGWQTPSLVPGAIKYLQVQVKPVNASSGSKMDVLVTATSAGNPTKQDAVRASTTVGSTP
jgi:uncharacterized membrane protein